MSHDVLGEAARALRDQTGAPIDARLAAVTRARVLGASRVKRGRKLFLVKTVVLLAAALLVASTAWGTPTVRASLQALAASVGLGPRVEVASGRPPSVSAAAVEPPAAAVAQVEASSAPALEAAIPSAPAAPPAAGARPARPPTLARSDRLRAPKAALPAEIPVADQPGARPRAPADDRDHDLYVVAHRLHFTDRNPAAALTAWDAYLRDAPGGRFASEAYYNRALCLVRLGRVAEARRALEPFARGGFGGYRQSEAKALLEAMPSASP